MFTGEVVVTPARIMQTGTGFWPSKVLLTAVKLDLFTLLSHTSRTAEDIREALQLQQRGLFDFLDALVAMKFLNREGLKEKATYCNSMEAELFLSRSSNQYMGGLLIMANERLYPFWHGLEAALKTGKPQNEIKEGNVRFFQDAYQDEQWLETFVQAMAASQIGNFISFARQFDFSPYSTLCDIGGAGAHLSMQVAIHQPHMSCTSFDLPAVAPVAERHIREANLEQRVSVASGDFFNDEFPKAEMITMGNILHNWDLETKKMLIKKACNALPVGGALVVIENVIDDERRENVFGLMMSLNMLIETDGGFDFTAAEFIGWAREAGFTSMSVMHLGSCPALVAYK